MVDKYSFYRFFIKFKEIIKEISLKNEKTFLTLLVSLGHLAFYISVLVGHDLIKFVTQIVHKELLLGQNKDDSSTNHPRV